MRNKWWEWSYTLTKTNQRNKVKRLTHKRDRQISKNQIDYEEHSWKLKLKCPNCSKEIVVDSADVLDPQTVVFLRERIEVKCICGFSVNLEISE